MNVALKLKGKIDNMKKILLLLLLLSDSLHASSFREEKIDLGKGSFLEVVNLKHEFWVGKYEVTQIQWLAVMGRPAPGSALACCMNDKRQRGDNRPMDDMGLSQAEAFCKMASEKTGKVIRLPTETEWEFFANGTDLKDAVCSVGMGKAGLLAPRDVGTKGPNRFGLYDVLGNVMEICSGNWDDYVDPKTGRKRKIQPMAYGGSKPWTCVRGGSYAFNSAEMMKIEARYFSIGKGMNLGSGVGFRVVMDK